MEDKESHLEEENAARKRKQENRSDTVGRLHLKEKTKKQFHEARKELCAKLSMFRDEIEFSPSDSKITSEIKLNITSDQNPLNLNPGLELNTDIYCDLLLYSMEHMPELLRRILASLTCRGHSFTSDDITRFAMLVNMNVVNCSIKPKFGTAMMKIKTIAAKAAGLTKEGLSNLNKVKVTQSPSSAATIRTQFANLALEMFKEQGAQGTCSLVIDNVAKTVQGKLQHFTQLYSSFEHDSLAEHFPSDDQMSLEERLKLFNLDTLDVESALNGALKNSLDTSALREVSRMIGENVTGFAFLLTEQPAIYNHSNKATAGDLSSTFKHPLIPLNVATTANMALVLEEAQERFLETVGMKSLDTDGFTEDFKATQSLDVDKLDRKAAEKRITSEIEKTGKMLVHGDIGIVEGMEAAKRLRVSNTTLYERLSFPMMVRVGLLHLLFNKTIQDIQEKMLVDSSVEDKLSMANFRSTCDLTFLSNQENSIKVCNLIYKYVVVVGVQMFENIKLFSFFYYSPRTLYF